MSFNQEQDTLKTTKLIIFLIVIEFLMFSASAIVTLSGGQEQDHTLLKRYYPTGYDLRIEDPVTGQVRVVTVPPGKYFDAKLNELVNIDTVTDPNELFFPEDPVSTLRLLIGFVTFNSIPYPLSIIPTVVSSIILIVIFMLGYSEIKSWISAWS